MMNKSNIEVAVCDSTRRVSGVRLQFVAFQGSQQNVLRYFHSLKICAFRFPARSGLRVYLALSGVRGGVAGKGLF